MLKKNGEKTINELSADRKSSRFTTVLMGISNLGLIGLIGYILMNQTVVIMPSEQTAKYTIGNDQANKEYFIDMTRDNVNLLYNVTPINVDENFGTLLKRVAPNIKKI
jgi:conjugal transfer pilus assembly protein TraE